MENAIKVIPGQADWVTSPPKRASKVLDAKGRCEWEESKLECWGLSRYLTDLSITVLRLRRVEERSKIIKLKSELYMSSYPIYKWP